MAVEYGLRLANGLMWFWNTRGQIREAGVTILLADQNVKFCRRIAQRAYILEKGLIQFEGTMAAVFENEALLSKYLAV